MSEKWKGPRLYAALYGLPIFLLGYTLASGRTPVAWTIVRVESWGSWAYSSNADSPWYWLFAAYLVCYFSAGLFFVFRWARNNRRKRHMKQGLGLVALDVVIIAAGFQTDIVLPVLGDQIPPLAVLVGVVWMAGFIFLIRKFKLMTIYEAASADLILETIIDPVFLLNGQGVIEKCNKACATLLGYPVDSIIGSQFSRFLKSRSYDRRNLDTLFRRKALRRIEIELEDAAGKRIVVVASFSVAETKLDGAIGIVANLHDVTQLKATQAELMRREESARALAEELDKLANFDKLTGLPNRRFFFRELELALRHQAETGEAFLLLFADLDGFKAVNDSYGHDIGDELLVEVARRIQATMAEGDIAARVGGDEFVVLARSFRTDAEKKEAADRLKAPFRKPIVIDGKRCAVGLSVGISRCPKDGASADELMKAADERMYEEKRQGKTERKGHFHH